MTYQRPSAAPTRRMSFRVSATIGAARPVRCAGKGFDDFWAMPTHVIFLSLIYPIAGLLIARSRPSATTCCRCSTRWRPASRWSARSPRSASMSSAGGASRASTPPGATPSICSRPNSFRAILALGLVLLALFGVWIAVAQAIYVAAFRLRAAPGIDRGVRAAGADHRRPAISMILIGNGVGFLFALVAFAISVVAFPLLIDRNIGATAAAHLGARRCCATRSPWRCGA